MRNWLTLILLVWGCAQIQAQEFTGVVKRQDSTTSAIYQANIEISEMGKPFKTLKTYFDGSYRIKLNKNQEYKISVSYPGYTDTTFVVKTDKNAIPTPAKVTNVLRKDGMRLLGVIRSREEDFPIKDATIVLRNVMTRKENRITTGIDGYYNFRLDYETNYRVTIDKFSKGIFNKYRDTTFYVSTVGFNLPLDYRLDIALEEATEMLEAREGYNPTSTPKPTKPIIEVRGDASFANKPTETASADVKPKKSKEPEIETVIIRDEPIKPKEDTSALAAAAANPTAVPEIIRKGLITKATKYTGPRFSDVTDKQGASDHCPVAVTIKL